MKEYQYSIIRRVSRNPKRNREGRGVSQSDLEALRQELAGDQNATVTAVRDDLELVDIASEDMRNRLETAEQALTSKLDSGEFSKWRTGDYAKRQSSLDEELRKKLGSEYFSTWQEDELKQALAGKASTGDVKQSAQRAIAEAIKRAGEMDKAIKVGGRNLIVTSRWKAGYLYGDRDENAYPVGSENYKVLVGYDTFRFDPVYIPTLGESEVTYKLYDNGNSKLGVVQIHAYDKDKKFLWWTVNGWEGKVGRTVTHTLPADTCYIRLGVTNDKVRAKVEFGTVATDWTPAPEDVAESVTALESKLLDPQQGAISKLETLLGKHSESFEELETHPLTVDEAGFWRIWSVKDSKYITTQYKSRGDKGDKGEDAGRYLGRAKRIRPNRYGNYMLETETGWRTAKEGDYVYLVGDLSNRGGDKDTFYIVREHKSKTDWEVYDIKGRTPRLTLDEQFHLLADGEMVSEISLRGKDGHTPGIRWHGTSLVIDNQQPVDLRGPQGEAGHSPDPEKVLNTERFQELLGGELKQRVAPVSDSLKTAQETIAELNKRSLTLQQKEDLGYLTSALRLKMAGGEGEPKTLEGLALQRYIALSGDNKTVSAYLASSELTAVLKAGVTGFGTINEREQVAINHDGTGHLGNLHFAGNQIDFKTGRDDAPYLSIGAWDMEPIDRFVKTTRVDDTPVSVYSLELSSKRKVYEQTISVANDGTRLTVHIDKLTCDCVLGSYAQLTLDGHLLTTWRGDVRDNDKGLDSGDFGLVDVPYRGENLSYERVVSAGTHTLRLEVVDKSRGGLALDGLTVRRYYDSGRRQSLLTKNGMRFYASADRYLDVDYRSQIITGYKPIPGLDGELPVYEKNPYIVRIKGGMQVDELDMPGVPLCGASFNEAGTQIKAFGKRAKRLGQNEAQAVYDYGMNAYKVYHSIGNTNYIPIVQVSGWSSNNINWSLTPRVYNVTSEYFVVRILSNNDNPQTKAISYVAFKTE